MLWQDIVIMVANIIFFISLVPQAYYGFKEKKGFITLAPSGPISIGLYAMSVCFYSLNLYFSSIVSFMTGTLWLVLFIQRMVYIEKHKADVWKLSVTFAIDTARLESQKSRFSRVVKLPAFQRNRKLLLFLLTFPHPCSIFPSLASPKSIF
jgi:hypothetical protein